MAFAGVVFVLFGVWLSGFWGDFFTDVGISFVIASVLGLVLESYLKERLFSEIESRVATSLNQFREEAIDAFHLQRLPADLLRAVRKTVIEEPIIEREITAHYKMSIVESNDIRALRADITSSVVYENLAMQSHRGEIYEGGCYLAEHFRNSSIAQDAGFVSVETNAIQGSVDPAFKLDRDSLRFHAADQGSQPQIRRVVEFSPGCRIRVSTREIAYFDLDDWDYFAASKPSIDMEISVSFPPGKFRLLGTPDDALIDYWEGEVDDEKGSGRWRIAGPLLPGQGVTFWWAPVDDQPSSSE